MKKVLMFVCLFVLSVLCFNACGKDEKVKRSSQLPKGWDVYLETNVASFINFHVNDTAVFYLTVYDENDVEVQSYDYSSAVWSLEPADAGTISDTTGRMTTFTATKPQNVNDFKLKWSFKGLSGERSFLIQE